MIPVFTMILMKLSCFDIVIIIFEDQNTMLAASKGTGHPQVLLTGEPKPEDTSFGIHLLSSKGECLVSALGSG